MRALIGRMRPRLAVVAALVLAATPGSGAVADTVTQKGDGFTWSFRCDGFGGWFPVDAAVVRAEGNIPAEFRLRGESSGTAVVGLAAFDCDPAVVDGAEAPFLYSLATVDLDPLDGAPGPTRHPGSYDFFKFTDSPRVHSRFEAMGVWIRHLEHLSVDVSGSIPTHGEARVPWKESPFRLIAEEGARGIPVPDGFPSDHWSKGRHGVTYGADYNCAGRGDPAVVTVETTPGTTMARILGARTVTVPGFVLRLSAAGHVAFEGQTKRPTECPTWE